MKKLLAVLFIFLFTCLLSIVLYANTNAEEGITPERDLVTGKLEAFTYPITATEGWTGIRYRIGAIHFTMTINGRTYEVSFSRDEIESRVFRNINSANFNGLARIRVQDIALKLSSQLGTSVDNAARIIQSLDIESGELEASATINIVQLNGTSNPPVIANINSIDEIDTIARNRYGFDPTSLADMRKYFANGSIRGSLPPPPPSPTGSHMDLIASLEELPDPSTPGDLNQNPWLDPNNVVGSALFNRLIIKAGYGIPIRAELRKFIHDPWVGPCGRRSRYTDFNINDVTITINSAPYEGRELNDYWKNPSSITTLQRFLLGIEGVGNERVRTVLIENSTYPLKKRKFYTIPTQQDGIYQINVTAETTTTWLETNIHDGCEWVTHTRSDGSSYSHWHHSTREEWHSSETYTDVKPLYIEINGSMFDDDQTIITR